MMHCRKKHQMAPKLLPLFIIIINKVVLTDVLTIQLHTYTHFSRILHFVDRTSCNDSW